MLFSLSGSPGLFVCRLAPRMPHLSLQLRVPGSLEFQCFLWRPAPPPAPPAPTALPCLRALAGTDAQGFSRDLQLAQWGAGQPQELAFHSVRGSRPKPPASTSPHGLPAWHLLAGVLGALPRLPSPPFQEAGCGRRSGFYGRAPALRPCSAARRGRAPRRALCGRAGPISTRLSQTAMSQGSGRPRSVC